MIIDIFQDEKEKSFVKEYRAALLNNTSLICLIHTSFVAQEEAFTVV